MNTYEIMFLFDPTFGSNWGEVETEISRLMQRSEAQIIMTKRLEERKLCFDIKKRKRGLYVISYFKAQTDKISNLERDIRLSENILRALILRADDVSEAKMKEVSLGSGILDTRREGEYDSRPPRVRSEGPASSSIEPEGELVSAIDDSV